MSLSASAKCILLGAQVTVSLRIISRGRWVHFPGERHSQQNHSTYLLIPHDGGISIAFCQVPFSTALRSLTCAHMTLTSILSDGLDTDSTILKLRWRGEKKKGGKFTAQVGQPLHSTVISSCNIPSNRSFSCTLVTVSNRHVCTHIIKIPTPPLLGGRMLNAREKMKLTSWRPNSLAPWLPPAAAVAALPVGLSLLAAAPST